MSNLDNSCKYLTNEKLCENELEKASRQLRCRNVENMTCCYLCMFVLNCATPCQFSGNSEVEPQIINHTQTPVKNTVINEQQQKEDKTKSNPITCCPSCNNEMLQTQTKFKIDKDSCQKLTNSNLMKTSKKELPIIVYICPKCGKIDLKVDEKQNKN